jgi:hypothetical protein
MVKLHDVLFGQSLFDLPENSGRRAPFPFEQAQTVPKPNDFSLSRGVHHVDPSKAANVNEKRADGTLGIGTAPDRDHQ